MQYSSDVHCIQVTRKMTFMNDLRFAPGGPGIEPRWTRGTKLAVGVATGILGLDGLGEAEVFADFSQWEIWQGAQAGEKAAAAAAAGAGEKPAASVAARPATGKKKLSYIEAPEYEGIERRGGGGR